MSITLTRRGLVQGLGAVAGSLVFAIHRDGDAAPAPPETKAADPAGVLRANLFVAIAPDGVVSIVCHRSEMGQGVRSTIPALIARELGADMAKVRVVQADGDSRYGDQNTDGSTSIRNFYGDLRMAGATARTMLVTAAARKWRVAESSLECRDHAVMHRPSKRSLGFGELVPLALALPVPKAAAVALRPDKEIAPPSKPMPVLDAPDIVTGAAKFGADVHLPGTLVAMVARPPVVGSRPRAWDEAAAMKVKGVRQVVRLPDLKMPAAFHPLGGVAVVAENTWAAMRGRAALAVQWESAPNDVYDSQAYRQSLFEAVRKAGTSVRNVGDIDDALAKAAKTLEAEYYVPHLTHAAMEPPAALASFKEGHCEIWAPTQNPQDAQESVAEALGIPEAKVTVHVTLLGGGFGRKSKPDYVVEAALLAKAVGRPVRVQWSREDDIRHSYFHTVSAQKLTAGLAADGRIVAWRHRTAFPSIGATFTEGTEHGGAGELAQGVTDFPLAVPAVRAEVGNAHAFLRIGWMRSVNNVQHAFAIGSFIDELAAARKRDRRDTWLEVIGPPRTIGPTEMGVAKLPNYGAPIEKHPIDTGRLRNVIERVTQQCGWAQRGRRALGLAAHRSFLSYVAIVFEVEHGPRGVVVKEAWVSADAGTIVNPDRVKAQFEGAVTFGLSSALHGRITARKGAIVQTNFRDYPIVRMPEVPARIHVDLVPSEAPPGGVGEPGVPPVAPALANAVFALTGRRIRELPLGSGELATPPGAFPAT